MNPIRTVYYSEEYNEFISKLTPRIKEKYNYLAQIIETQHIVSTKFVKKLENTEFYEARVSVGNDEYRTIIFAIDSESFIESKRVIFLNSFHKKSTKQYKNEIQKAQNILMKYRRVNNDTDR